MANSGNVDDIEEVDDYIPTAECNVTIHEKIIRI